MSIPEGIAPDELTPEKVDELFLGGGGERKLGEHPETGEPIVLKSGRYGPYVVQRRAQRRRCCKSQSPDSLTLERGAAAADPAPAGRQGRRRRGDLAANGRYGPYVEAGRRLPLAGVARRSSSRSRWRRRWRCWRRRRPRQRRAAAPPLREMGVDPLTEKPLVIKDGRFGPYVTDGETNASLRRGQTPEALTIEQACEMLAEKRANPSAPRKKAAKKAPAKKATKATKTAKATKATAKKATAKKATGKKAAPKKAAAKKST